MVPDSPSIPVLSLFSGAGGLDLGFEACAFEPRLALDFDPAAVETYNWNRRGRLQPARGADLSQVDGAEIAAWWDVVSPDESPRGVIGGPPCQAFSVSNVHHLEDDPRARLPLAYAAILADLNRRWRLDFFLFENVAGLGHRAHAASLEEFKRRFADAGFENVHEFYLDAVDFQVPQFRRRMFIAGVRNGAGFSFEPPVGNRDSRVTVADAIGDLAEPYPHKRGGDPVRHGLHPNHWYMNPRSRKFGDGSLKPGEMWGRSFRTLRWDEPSWTVAYGHREVHVHPSGKRRLSVFEALLLQGFPPRYELRGSLTDQIRQVSDAVPPPLAAALAAAIRDALTAHRQDSRNGQIEHLGDLGLQTVAPRSTRA